MRARLKPVTWLALPIFLTCAAGWYAHPAAWRPHHQDDLFSHAVYAYRQWQSTGVQLSAGDRFTMRATGKWLYSPLVGFHGPEGGQPAVSAYPLPQVRGGALIGRIGENGAPFYVGRRTVGYAEADGLLYLRINDDLLGDNDGQLAVEIDVLSRDEGPTTNDR